MKIGKKCFSGCIKVYICIVTDVVVVQELELKCQVADLAEEVAAVVEAAEGEVIPPETGQ